jgi:hypothetical protein
MGGLSIKPGEKDFSFDKKTEKPEKNPENI